MLGLNALVVVWHIRRKMKNEIRITKLDRLNNLRKYLAAFLLRSDDRDGKEEAVQNLYAILVTLDTNTDDHKELHNLIKDHLEFINNNDSDKNRTEAIVKQANKVFNADILQRDSKF